MSTEDMINSMEVIQAPYAQLTNDELVALAQVLKETSKDLLKVPKILSIVFFRAERIESLQKALWILGAMDTINSVISGVRQALHELTTEEAIEAANRLS